MGRETAPRAFYATPNPENGLPCGIDFWKTGQPEDPTARGGIGVSLGFSGRRRGTPCLQRCADRVSQALKTAVRMPVPFQKPPDLIATCRVDVRRMSWLERKTTRLLGRDCDC